MKFPFVGPAYTARSPDVDSQRCVNLYPEMDVLGKQVLALYGTPGLRRLATATAASECRGAFVTTGPTVGQKYLYIVSGNKLYRYDTVFAETELGTLNTSSGQVSLASNATQLMLVDGGDGYIVTLSSGAFAAISDPQFPANPDRVAYIDSFFIVNDSGTNNFYISATNDGTSWDALDTAAAEGAPDAIMSVFANHRELWLLGEKTAEVWYNSGDSDFPFTRIQGAFIEQGCAAKHSVGKIANTLFWLGSNEQGQGVVWSATGYVPQRVSTHALETAIRSYSTIADAIAYTYQEEGHHFYVLTLPTAGRTWVYDTTIGLWHERAYRNTTDGSLTRHRSNCYAYFNGMHVVGDFQNGEIYELDLDTYSDDGDPIRALRACKFISDDSTLANLFHSRLQIDMETGVGITSGQGSDPEAMLRWSDDGGHTWSNEHWKKIGALGNYGKRVLWNRLGSARNRTYEWSMTDPVKRVIIGANLNVSKGHA